MIFQVNCIEAHPRFPVLATSGLDKDVKIWIPKSGSDPNYNGIERVSGNYSAATRVISYAMNISADSWTRMWFRCLVSVYSSQNISVDASLLSQANFLS